jgi:hypothetical protein
MVLQCACAILLYNIVFVSWLLVFTELYQLLHYTLSMEHCDASVCDVGHSSIVSTWRLFALLDWRCMSCFVLAHKLAAAVPMCSPVARHIVGIHTHDRWCASPNNWGKGHNHS